MSNLSKIGKGKR